MNEIKTGISKENENKIISEYLRNGMVMYRAVQTVMPNFSVNSAKVVGSKVKKKYERFIREKNEEIKDKADPRLILTINERKKTLSEIAQGISVDGRSVSDKDRISAIKVLNAMEGIGTSGGTVTNNYLSIEDTKALVSKKLENVLDVEWEENVDTE